MNTLAIGALLLLLAIQTLRLHRQSQRLRTEAEQALKPLRISQAMFAAAFRNSPHTIVISRQSDGHIIEANRAFANLTGWPQSDSIGRTLVDLGIWPDSAHWEALIRQIPDDGVVHDVHCTIGTRHGQPRSCVLNASTVPIDGDTCLIAVIRDVTEEKAAASALQESQIKFSTIFALAPFALSLTRIDDRTHVDANPAWERLFGVDRRFVLARTTGELGFWVDQDAYNAIYEGIARSEVVEQREVRIRPRGRDEIATCLISGRRLRIQGSDCALWSLVDISELRRVQARIEELNQGLERRVSERTMELSAALEALRQTQEELVRSEKLAALGSLVAGIAHELNTPIGNSVTVATTLVARTEELAAEHAAGQLRRSRFDNYVSSVRGASDLLMKSLMRAQELVRSFKQVAVDQTSEKRRGFELGGFLHELAVTLGPMFKGTPHTLEIDSDEGLSLDSYPGPLGQVVTNLVSNALLHGLAGRPAGHITIIARADTESTLRLEFSDDGVGIPARHLQRIFDPFFTTRLGTGGSGLGLHIVYNLVTRILGGHIRVESQAGAGTRFTLMLPRVAPDKCDSDEALGISKSAAQLNFEDIGPII